MNGTNGQNMKNNKDPREYLLLLSLVITALIIAVIGLSVSREKGPISAFMEFVKDGFVITDADTDIEDPDTDPEETAGDDTDSGTVSDTDKDPEQSGSGGSGSDSNTDSDTETEGEVIIYPEPDPSEYYKDVLFLGDSRTVGLYLYGKIEGAKYFARTSMNVGNCFADKESETGTGSLNLTEYLSENKFGKIYILLGINEIGNSYNWIVSRYKTLISKLRELQPDAVIVIQSNMHVTKKKSDANPKTFNNKRINELNLRLSALADGEKVYYLGFEQIFDDENGRLKSEYTGDGVHLKGKYYKIWKQYLLEDGMIRFPVRIPVSQLTATDTAVPPETDVQTTTDTATSSAETTKKETAKAETTKPITTQKVTVTEPETTEKLTATETEISGAGSETAGDTSTAEGSSSSSDSAPETTPQDPPEVGGDEDADYFDDALFIGDSRTVGFYTHGRIDGAKYFARTSMNVKNCFADKASETGTGSLNLTEYLTENKFGKIYILLGINEIGYSYSWITSKYQTLINKIIELQPDAKIIIQSNMHVTKAKSDANPKTFNNARIDNLNSRLSKFADGEKIFYADLVSAFDDESGNLRTDYTGDGIHFKSAAYKVWKSWIEQNGKF